MAGCWWWCRRTCVCCLSEDEKTSVAVDKEIQRILKQQKKKEKREIKILLLGNPAHTWTPATAVNIKSQINLHDSLVRLSPYDPVWGERNCSACLVAAKQDLKTVRHVSLCGYVKNGQVWDWLYLHTHTETRWHTQSWFNNCSTVHSSGPFNPDALIRLR